MGFEKVFSVEILQRFIDRGKNTFRKEIDDNRYFIIADDSANLAYHLDPVIDDKVIFWLDAHRDNGLDGAVCDPIEVCPVVHEIKSLRALNKKPIILVDDIRIIETYHQPWDDRSGNAINLDKVLSAINSLPFEYEISYVATQWSPKDILVAV